jgi:hypothetical protein
VKISSFLNQSARTFAARLLPPVFSMAISIAVFISGSTAHAQANFAGSEATVETWQNAYLSGISVSPSGGIDICNQTDGTLHEAGTLANFEFSYFPEVAGWPNVCPVVGPTVQVPMAEDAFTDIYFLFNNQLQKSFRNPSNVTAPVAIASGFTNPTGLVLDLSGNVYVADNGTGQVFKVVPFEESSSPVPYGTPTPLFTWSGIQYVAIDGQGSLYAAGGYGATSGFVVKARWNAGQFDAPVLIASGLNDITGIAADPAGNVFVSSDDNQESALIGQTYSPAAIVDLWEIPLAPSSPSGYATPIPMGGGDFYNAQGIQSDSLGNLYVLWIGGPRGSFSYNVEKIDPHGLINFGSVKTNATSQRQVTFWITGTEQIPPTVSASTPEFTAAGTGCVPDAGIPLGLEGFPVACSAPVTFAPQGLGTRTGTAWLVSGDSSTSIASVNLTGIGLPTYDANVTIALSQSTITYPASTIVTISVFDQGDSISPAPDGTVTLNVDGVAWVTLPIRGAGHGFSAAYYTLKGVAVGPHVLTATYSGGGFGLYQPGTSGPFSLNVLPAPVTLTASCQNPTIVHGGAYKCEVYTQPVKAGAGTWITYKLDANAPVTAPLSSGAATFTIPDPALGPHTVAISLAAQGGYAAASPVNESFTVVAPH